MAFMRVVPPLENPAAGASPADWAYPPARHGLTRGRCRSRERATTALNSGAGQHRVGRHIRGAPGAGDAIAVLGVEQWLIAQTWRPCTSFHWHVPADGQDQETV